MVYCVTFGSLQVSGLFSFRAVDTMLPGIGDCFSVKNRVAVPKNISKLFC